MKTLLNTQTGEVLTENAASYTSSNGEVYVKAVDNLISSEGNLIIKNKQGYIDSNNSDFYTSIDNDFSSLYG